MARPSLQASDAGIQLAEQALTLSELDKQGLSKLARCSRQPVTNFFKGVAIDQGLFVRLCDCLSLDWRQVAGLVSMTEDAAVTPKLDPGKLSVDVADVDGLVRMLRQSAKDSLCERCGTMRVLDMREPVALSRIYTSVNVLEQISGHQRRKLTDLLAEANAGSFDRLGFGPVSQPREPVMEVVEKYHRLIVLGKPGAGKTTFLKYLAIRCIEGKFEPDRLPLFINLKQFSEHPSRLGLLAFLSQRHLKSQLTALSPADIEAHLLQLKQVLNAGRALILLDGLDEVSQETQDRVLTEIRLLSEDFHDNHFVMTCRVAAWEYTFEQFTEVEIADFDAGQVQAFARQWFEGKAMQAQTFLNSLARWPQLAELAVTPLLLTLMCVAFESSGALPGSRSELYQEGIETLLKKWDASRGIHRDQVYKRLSPRRKEDLLSEIAIATFRQGQYFFHQRDLEYMITDYIRNLPEASDDPEVLQVDSLTVLHSIEAQHGLLVERAKHHYSFSHLTFHEYFVARELVLNSNNLEKAMAEMVRDHALETSWREVFLLSSELLRNAELLLLPLAKRANAVLADEPRLQSFLADVEERAAQPKFEGFEPAAVRAFLFDIDFKIDINRNASLRLDPQANLLVCASFLTRMLRGVELKAAIALATQYDQQATDEQPKIVQARSADDTMIIAIQIALNSQQLGTSEEERLQNLIKNFHGETAKQEDIKAVADAARHMAKNRYQIEKTWMFEPDEMQLLTQYYRMTSLLVDCLASDGCTISPERRRSLKASLFCPISSFGPNSGGMSDVDWCA